VQRLSDPGVFEFRRARSHRVPEVRVETSERMVLTPPLDLKRVVTASVRTTSYSALTAVSLVHADVGRDVDALPERPLEVDAAGQIGAVELPLAELPPGPRTGEALHELLEHTDFASFQASSSAPDVAATLTRFGLDAARFEQPVRRGVSRVLDVRLLDTEPELKLRSLAAGSYRAELEFLMRVSHLRAETLAASFGSELSGVSDDYVSDIQRLKFDPVTGYLRGFIDLVFEHAGRFYVVDYKSNALGAGIDAYSASAIEQTMRLHHYPIQAALYAAAVDRWLRVTRQGYRYAEHFGGVFYLFLRGMAPEFGHSRGVFFHRPSEGALHRFDAMLEGDSA
jgi:exodeoxyribonuclease V beta subunit